MLIRIVRMTFQPDKVQDFLTLFEGVEDKIRNFEGCRYLELMQDYHDPSIYSTFSMWEDDKALDKYRNSDVFGDVWPRTKALFADKPKAFSMRSEADLPMRKF